MLDKIKQVFAKKHKAVSLRHIQPETLEADLSAYIQFSGDHCEKDVNHAASMVVEIMHLALSPSVGRDVNGVMDFVDTPAQAAWLLEALGDRLKLQPESVDWSYVLEQVAFIFNDHFRHVPEDIQVRFVTGIFSALTNHYDFDINQAEDAGGWNTLMLALRSYLVHTNAIKALIDIGSDVNYRTSAGRPIHSISLLNPLAHIKYQLLLSHGADLLIEERFQDPHVSRVEGLTSPTSPLFCSSVKELVGNFLHVANEQLKSGVGFLNPNQIEDAKHIMNLIEMVEKASAATEAIPEQHFGANRKQSTI